MIFSISKRRTSFIDIHMFIQWIEHLCKFGFTVFSLFKLVHFVENVCIYLSEGLEFFGFDVGDYYLAEGFDQLC